MLFAHGRGSLPASDLILLSAARTAAPAAVKLSPMGAKGLIVIINVTNAGTGSITVTVNGNVYPAGKKDGVTPVQWVLLASAAIVANGTVVLQIGPELGDTPNLKAEALLPDEVEIDVAHNNANSITYSVMGVLTI